MQYAKSLVSLCWVFSCAAEFEPGCDICLSCGRDVALWDEHLVQHTVKAKFSSLQQHRIFLPELTFSADSCIARNHTTLPCNHSHWHPCANYEFQAVAAVPLFGHTNIKRTLGQPLKTACGCPNGTGRFKNDRNSSPKRQVYYLLKKRNTDEEEYIYIPVLKLEYPVQVWSQNISAVGQS